MRFRPDMPVHYTHLRNEFGGDSAAFLGALKDHERVLRLDHHPRTALDARNQTLRDQPFDDLIGIRATDECFGPNVCAYMASQDSALREAGQLSRREFADEHHRKKLDELGDPLVEIESHIELLTFGGSGRYNCAATGESSRRSSAIPD